MTPSHTHMTGIILAAGTSSRMGKTKQLLPFGETTLLGQVIDNARNSTLSTIIVVLGHDAEKIEKTIDLSGTTVVLNPLYSKGQSTSLAKGLEIISPQSDAAMFLLGDQPFVTPEIINTLCDAFTPSQLPIAIPYCRGNRGNPVIIGRPLFHRLTSLSADTGARVLFNEFKNSILKVSGFDEAVLTDVDTPDDYARLKNPPGLIQKQD